MVRVKRKQSPEFFLGYNKKEILLRVFFNIKKEVCTKIQYHWIISDITEIKFITWDFAQSRSDLSRKAIHQAIAIWITVRYFDGYLLRKFITLSYVYLNIYYEHWRYVESPKHDRLAQRESVGDVNNNYMWSSILHTRKSIKLCQSDVFLLKDIQNCTKKTDFYYYTFLNNTYC